VVEGDGRVGAAERLGVLAEEAGGVVTPALVEREDRVVRRPRQDQRVVQGDDQGDQHLPPADELGPAAEAAPGGGGGAAPAVPDRVVEEEQRDARGQQRDEIRQDERAAAVLVGDCGEAPDVAEADGGADGREDEGGAAAERTAIGALGGGAGGRGWCTHDEPPGELRRSRRGGEGPTSAAARGRCAA